MSDNRRNRTNLLNNVCFANNKRFDRYFSGARKEPDGGDVRGTDRKRALERRAIKRSRRRGRMPARSMRRRAIFGWLGRRGR